MTLDFAYSFEQAAEREALLEEAASGIRALTEVLGDPTDPARPTEAQQAALQLLQDLQRNVAKFAEAAPDLLPLSDEFAAKQLQPTPDVSQLARDHRFYWLRIPYTLQSKAEHRFDRLEFSIEMNPGAGALARPRILSALPRHEFVTITETTLALNLGIDEGLQFAVARGAPTPSGAPTSASAHVRANAGGALGFVAGPFTYRVRKAVIESGPLPSERVFWRISGTEKLEEPPELVAVIAVPNDTTELRIAAALQAYSSAKVLTMTLAGFIQYLGSRLKTFFSSGAPLRATQVWDLSSRL